MGKNNIELYNSIIMSPRNWIKNFLPNKYEIFEDLRKTYVEGFISKFNKINISRKTYSTYKLFKNDLSYNEKIYILQRIGLLETIIMLSNTFQTGNYIIINKQDEFEINLNFDKFITKAKATIIEVIWNDNKNNNIPMLNNILSSTLPKELDKNFF